MTQTTMLKESPVIDIMGSMTRIFNNCPFDDEIRFIHNGTIYTFQLMDNMTWTLKRKTQNMNKYDVRYGEITYKPDIKGLKPMYVNREFDGWDGSVEYSYGFKVHDDNDRMIGNWDFNITIPREIATITL